MVFKNPLSAEICVKGVKIYLKSLTEEEQDLCEGKVEVEGAEDLNLSPHAKEGQEASKTLVERRGMFYSRDKSMEFAVTGARPMVELSLVEDLVSEVYAGEERYGLERLSCAFSHDSFFWICDDQGPEKGRSIYETDDEGQEGEIVLELPNHLVNEPPKLIVDKLEPGSSMRFVLGCRGESVGRHETCWLFSFQSATTGECFTYRHVQRLVVLPSLDIIPIITSNQSRDAFYSFSIEIENKGFNEDLELLMVGTFGSHWKSKLRSDKKSDWVLVNREGESRVRRIEFDIFPWSDSEEDRMTALMLKQLKLKKFLIKEELKDSDVCCSKVKVCACTTGLAGGRTIKLNSTRLLETIASSHRNLRKKEISSTFKTLRDSDISLIFPLSSTRSLDLVLLWRTTDSQRIGHHYLSDLKFGILESFEGKAGGMYEESQREQKALLGQWKRSEYGRMEDPIRVELEVENDFFDWNFKRDGLVNL
ncbi:hypothetical protein BY996DRAFT_7997921 [Phakopsora pachyrhizi]|nr:hypothetical protein BY996DRAFT_7997921 [Phakopsora pachyrhizi]